MRLSIVLATAASICPSAMAEPAAHWPTTGSITAKVTIVELGHHVGPQGWHAVVRDAAARDPNGIRWIWLDAPVERPNDRAAAVAARALLPQGVDRFLAMHEAISAQSTHDVPDDVAKYESIVAHIPGVDVAAWRSAIADPAVERAIGEDVRVLNSLGIKGSPAFFVNGEMLPSTQETLPESLRWWESKDKETAYVADVIERQRKRADRVKGLAGDALYAALVKSGKATAHLDDKARGSLYHLELPALPAEASVKDPGAKRAIVAAVRAITSRSSSAIAELVRFPVDVNISGQEGSTGQIATARDLVAALGKAKLPKLRPKNGIVTADGAYASWNDDVPRAPCNLVLELHFFDDRGRWKIDQISAGDRCDGGE